MSILLGKGGDVFSLVCQSMAGQVRHFQYLFPAGSSTVECLPANSQEKVQREEKGAGIDGYNKNWKADILFKTTWILLWTCENVNHLERQLANKTKRKCLSPELISLLVGKF